MIGLKIFHFESFQLYFIYQIDFVYLTPKFNLDYEVSVIDFFKLNDSILFIHLICLTLSSLKPFSRFLNCFPILFFKN